MERDIKGGQEENLIEKMARRIRGKSEDLIITYAILGGLIGLFITGTPGGAIWGGLIGGVVGWLRS